MSETTALDGIIGRYLSATDAAQREFIREIKQLIEKIKADTAHKA